MINFKRAVDRLNDALGKAKNQNVGLDSPPEERSFLDFNNRKKVHIYQMFYSAVEDVKKYLIEVSSLNVNDPKVKEIIELANELDQKKLESLDKCAKRLKELVNYFDEGIEVKKVINKRVSLPDEINSEITADLEEMDKCFKNGCYRSSVVLCGRVLETALHRKYFETTNTDLLEKSPGIGLGKIIAKLEEKGIKLDPGLTQQIHLINQIRVFSVHTKKEAFYPSKEQAEAMMLFTIDVLNKLFKKK